MANLLEGIGQAYAQDYRNVRKEREEREKDYLKQRLMYMALSPIGETLVQGAVNFIKQPFAEKHEDFVERENARGGIIQQRRNVEKEVDAVQKTIDTWNDTAAQNGMNIYDAARHTQRVRSNDEFNRIVGNDWRTAVRYTKEQRAKINSVFEAMQSTIDENSVTLVDDSIKFVEDFGKGRFRSSEDIEKALEKNKLHGNAGQILLRKVKGIFSDEPVDLKAKARAEAAPNFYSFLQDRTEYNDSLARARRGINYNLKEQGLEDIVETATESERQRQVALRKSEDERLRLDEMRRPLEERELAQQEHFNIFVDGGKGAYSELTKDLDTLATRALKLGIDSGKITYKNFESSVGQYINNKDGQGLIASRVRSIKNYETYNKIKTEGLSAVISEENLPLAKKLLPFFSKENSYQFVEEINSGDQDGFYTSQAIKKLAEDNVSRISSDLISSSSESSLRKQQALLDRHIEVFISKAEQERGISVSDAKKIELEGDLRGKIVTKIRAEVNQRLGNVLEDNQIFEVGKARSALTLLTDDLAQYGAENGFNFNEYQISEELEKSFSNVSEGITTVETDPDIDPPPRVLTNESISQAVKEGQSKAVALSHVKTLDAGGETTNPKLPLMTSKDSSLVYDSGTFRFTLDKVAGRAAADWDNIENVLGMFSDEDAAIIKTDMQSRQLVIKDLEEKLGMSYPEAIKITRKHKAKNLFTPPEDQEESTAQKMRNNSVFKQLSKELSRLDLPGLDTDVVSPFGDRDFFTHNKTYEFIMGEEFSIEEESPSVGEPTDPDRYSYGPEDEQQITSRSPELGPRPGEQGPANSFVETGDDIIRAVVNLIPIKKPLNKNVVDEEQQQNLFTFLDQIATVESNKGQDKGTYDISSGDTGRGSLGVFQIDEVAFDEIKHRAVGDKTSFKRFKKHLGVINGFLEDTIGKNMNTIEFEDIADDRVNALFARLYLLTKPDKIPSTNLGRARLWKKVYNTEKGRGTDIRYLRAVGDIESHEDWLKKQMDRIESQSLLSRTPVSSGSLDSESATQRIF